MGEDKDGGGRRRRRRGEIQLNIQIEILNSKENFPNELSASKAGLTSQVLLGEREEGSQACFTNTHKV